MSFTQVSPERAAADAVNYQRRPGALPEHVVKDDIDGWYQLLPAKLKDQPTDDPKSSIARFFYTEQSDVMPTMQATAAVAERMGLNRDFARISGRMHARVAISSMVRTLIRGDSSGADRPYVDWQDGAPGAETLIIDFDEATQSDSHSVLVGTETLSRLTGEAYDDPAAANGRWFYDDESGLYAQAVYPPEPSPIVRHDLEMATGSEEAAADVLAAHVQLKMYLGTAAVSA